MITNKIQWLVRLTAGALLIAGATGCQTQKPDAPALVHGEDFVPPDAERPVYQFNTMEAANAAHLDATLRAYHFDGGTLNSLGEERLDLMLRNGDTPTPLVVYLDIPADDSKTESRRKVVTAFLKDRGLAADQIELRSGRNPDVNSPVAPLLAAQNTPSSAGAAAPSTPSASAATNKNWVWLSRIAARLPEREKREAAHAHRGRIIPAPVSLRSRVAVRFC